VAQVEGLAARQPVLTLNEDVHWSDPTSLELLDLIIDRVSALPVLLVITYRPEFSAPWTGRPHVTALTLSRLAPRQRAEMIVGVTGGKALPAEIAGQIAERTDGVPLFVEELTKAVVESGMLTDLGDRYTAAGPVTPLAIPASLQASLLARLDRLAPVREVAQIGAALGRQFSHELIAAVASMPSAQLDETLAQLVGAELIYRRGTPPDAEYTFKHALVQDAAYSTLLRGRRQQLHTNIATTLEGRFSEIVAAQPALLAHHCTEAGLIEKAVNYWLAAGRQAWRRSAAAEAVSVLQRGLALVPALPDGDRRREVEFEILIAVGQALAAQKGWGVPEGAEAYLRARGLAITLKRPRELLFPLCGQWTYYTAGADLRRARQLAAEIGRLGEDTGDIAAQLLSRWASSYTSLQQGEFAVALDEAEQGLALFDPADRPFYAEVHAFDPLVCLLLISARSLVFLGRFDQGLSRQEAALAEARRLSHPQTLACALLWGWGVGAGVGRTPSSLLAYADELLALSTERGFEFYRAMGTVMRGWCLVASGRADESIALVIAGLADLRVLRMMTWEPVMLTVIADACRKAGELQSALGHLADARRFARETQARWNEAETLRLYGEVLKAMGDPEGAEAGYREAIGLAQQQQAKLWELGAAISLARFWRDHGKRSDARDLLAPVYSWFTEGFGTPILQAAKALLDELA
jgi:tetratricopeptide (TPR) repeat protein